MIKETINQEARTEFPDNLTELMEQISDMDQPDQKLLSRLAEKMADQADEKIR